MDLFSFGDVVVELGGRRVLDHLDGTIADDGRITCILGPSGSGKSTLLRLCNRLEVPSRGVVRFRGDDVATLDPLTHRRQVGMVFQRPSLFPGTVHDNLRVAVADVDRGSCHRALARADLGPEFLDRVGDELSGGEAQRVCLARTLVTGPSVLLMDEPTSALDPTSTLALERTAIALVEAGVAIVWVTHDLEQADRLGAHRLVVVDGRVADEHARAHFLAAESAEHAHDDDDGQHEDDRDRGSDGPG